MLAYTWAMRSIWSGMWMHRMIHIFWYADFRCTASLPLAEFPTFQCDAVWVDCRTGSVS